MYWSKPYIGADTPARETTDLGDVWNSAWESMRLVNSGISGVEARERAYDNRMDAITKAGIKHDLINPERVWLKPDLVDRMRRQDMAGEIPEEDPHIQFNRKLKELESKHPEYASIIKASRSPQMDAEEMARNAEMKAADVYARAEGYLPGLPGGVSLLSGMGASFYDPVNLASLLAGPYGRVGKTAMSFLWNASKTGLVNAGAETLIQPDIQEWRKRAGLDYGLNEAAQNIGGAFAFGFGLDALVRGGYRGIQKSMGRVPMIEKDPVTGQPLEGGGVIGYQTKAQAAEDALRQMNRRPPPADPEAALEAESHRLPPNSIPSRAKSGDLAAMDEVIKNAGIADDPSVKGARAAAQIDAEMKGEVPPLTDANEGLEQFTQALRNLTDGSEPPARGLDPVAPIRKGDTIQMMDDATVIPPGRYVQKNRAVTSEMVPVSEIGADPEMFQFRRGGNPSLQAATQWDDAAGGRFILYERADGSKIVVDGHARLDLAKRSEAAGGPKVTVQALTYKEADGWTPNEVKALAAKKNLQEGKNNVTALDAATVLRFAPDAIDATMSIRPGVLAQARKLARLSDEAFAEVVNGDVRPNHAALVGELVPDKSTHKGIIDVLHKLQPPNEREARAIVADLSRSPTQHIHRVLAGVGQDAAIIGERAKVLDAAMRLLKDDQHLFGLLSEHNQRIESVGQNQPDLDANIAFEGQSFQIRDMLERSASQPGPIRDMLNEAAIAVKGGMEPRDAAKMFVDDLREIVDREGMSAFTEVERPLGGAWGIDEPGGPQAKAQIEALEAEQIAQKATRDRAVAERNMEKWFEYLGNDGRQIPQLNPEVRERALKHIADGKDVEGAIDKAVSEQKKIQNISKKELAEVRKVEEEDFQKETVVEVGDQAFSREEVDSVVDMVKFVQTELKKKLPESLTDFLIKQGGIRDWEGEVRSMIGAPNMRPGLINKAGEFLDDLTLRAWEGGFLPNYAERPEINDLLAELMRDLGGDRVVRAIDEPAMENYRVAKEMESELGRLGIATDIFDPGKASSRKITEEEVRQILGQKDNQSGVFEPPTRSGDGAAGGAADVGSDPIPFDLPDDEPLFAVLRRVEQSIAPESREDRILSQGYLPQDFYHATTHKMRGKTFSDPRNTDGKYETLSYHGRAVYMTSEVRDANRNYAGMGPDLTGRVERRAEEAHNAIDDIFEMDREYYQELANDLSESGIIPDYWDKTDDGRLAWAMAFDDVAGDHGGAVYPLRINPKNAVELGGPNETRFDYDTSFHTVEKSGDEWVVKDKDGKEWGRFEDESEAYDEMDALDAQTEPTGSGAKLLQALKDNLHGVDGNGKTELLEAVQMKLLDYQEIKAGEFEKLVRNAEIYPDEGLESIGQFLQQVYRDAGFDAVIMHDADKVFPGMDMPSGTTHVALFDPRRVRSSLSAKFDPDMADAMDLLAAISGRSRAIDELGFYSKALESAAALKQEKGTGEQMLAMLKTAGVKEAEIKTLGLDKYLTGKKQVTRDEIVGFIEQGKPQIREAIYAGKEWDGAKLRENDRTPNDDGTYDIDLEDRISGHQFVVNVDEDAGNVFVQGPGGRPIEVRAPINRQTWRDAFAAIETWLEAEAVGNNSLHPGAKGPAKWSDYALDGSNPTYRETVLHLGDREKEANARYEAFAKEIRDKYLVPRSVGWVDVPMTPDERAKMDSLIDAALEATDNKTDFRSGHWPEPNVIAHIRSSIQPDQSGKPIFLIDELQSDWGQKIRDGGVQDPAKIADLEKRKEVLTQEAEALRRPAMDELGGRWYGGDRTENWLKAQADAYDLDSTNPLVVKIRDWAKRWDLNDAELRTAKASTPGHPMVNTTDQWVTTALRRIIKQAVDSGAEGIAITPGKLQAERFNIARVVGGLRFVEAQPEVGMYTAGFGFLMGLPPEGGNRYNLQQSIESREALDGMIGREMADRLLAQPLTALPNGRMARQLDNLGELDVGGHGMRAVYDNIYPRTLGKLLGKMDPDVKRGDVRLRSSSGEMQVSNNMRIASDGDEYWVAGWPREGFGEQERAISPRFASYKAADDFRESLRKGQYAEPFHYFPITDKIRKAVTEDGQPMFAAKPPKPPKLDEQALVKGAILLASGKTMELHPTGVWANLEAIRPMMHMVPADVPVGVLEKVEPAGKGAVLIHYRTPDGKTFQVKDKSLATVAANRGGTFFKGGRAVVLIHDLTMGLAGEATRSQERNVGLSQIKSSKVVSTLLHELVHVFRVLGGRDGFTGDAWATIVRIAHDQGVLDMPSQDFLKKTGWDGYGDADTLRQIYQETYARYSSLDEYMDQEAVAGILELAYHKQLPSEVAARIQPLLDTMFGEGNPVSRMIAANENDKTTILAAIGGREAMVNRGALKRLEREDAPEHGPWDKADAPSVKQYMPAREAPDTRWDDPALAEAYLRALEAFEDTKKNRTTQLNAIGGIRSKSANLAKLEMAQEMENAGRAATEIWQLTKWERDPATGHWKTEIPDDKAKLIPDIKSKSVGGRAGDLLPHELLWDAYPELKNVKVDLIHSPGEAIGMADLSKRKITVKAGTIEERRKLLLAELQKFINRKEGFGESGTPQAMRPVLRRATMDADREGAIMLERYANGDDIDMDALYNEIIAHGERRTWLDSLTDMQAYQALAGRQKSIAVMRRARMAKVDRSQIPPSAMELAPGDRQIISHNQRYQYMMAGDDWEDDFWDDVAKQAFSKEIAIEKQNAKRVHSRETKDESPVGHEATAYLKKVQDFHRKVLSEGKSFDEAARAIEAEFGFPVNPAKLAVDDVWWHAADIMKSERSKYWPPDALKKLAEYANLGYPDDEITRRLDLDFPDRPRSFSEKVVAMKRLEQAIPAWQRQRADTWTGAELTILYNLKRQGLTASDIAAQMQTMFPGKRAFTGASVQNKWDDLLGLGGSIDSRAIRAHMADLAQTRATPGRPRIWSEQAIKMAVDDLENGATHAAIARSLNERLATDIFKRENVTALAKDLGFKRRLEWTPEAIADLTSDDIKNLTAADAAQILSRKYGVELSKGAVRAQRKKMRDIDSDGLEAASLENTAEVLKVCKS